jgi:ABC-type arginine transport system permease subunit
MSDAPSPEVPPLLRTKLWPVFFTVLIVLLNAIALVILYGDTTLTRDGKPAADMVRDAFMAVAKLNLILAGVSLVSMYLLSRNSGQRT